MPICDRTSTATLRKLVCTPLYAKLSIHPVCAASPGTVLTPYLRNSSGWLETLATTQSHLLLCPFLPVSSTFPTVPSLSVPFTEAFFTTFTVLNVPFPSVPFLIVLSSNAPFL